MVLEVKNVKDTKISDIKLFCAVYGDAGTGKTTLGSTFPKPFYIDCDQGLLSIRGKDVKYVTIKGADRTWPSVRQAVQMAAADPEVESIIVDSMTGVCEICMDHTMMINKNISGKATFDDWAIFANNLRDLVTLVRGANKHALFILHEVTDKDELTGRVWCRPLLQGQMKAKFAAYFDEFYHAEVVNVPGKDPEYRLLVRPTSIYTGKSRLIRDPKITYIKPHFGTLISLTTK